MFSCFSLIFSCFAETLQLVVNYLQDMYEDGMIIGGKVISIIYENSSNPEVNPYQDNVFPPKTENDAMNRLSVSNTIYHQIVCIIPCCLSSEYTTSKSWVIP